VPARDLPPADRQPPGSSPWLLPLLLVLFLLSGFCALIYQVLWLRLLALVFGVTVYAASTVLASFMTGLAIGSYTAGHVADRAKRPLALFGIAELLVGVTALATPWALEGVKQLYVAWHPAIGDNLGLLTLARLVLSFVVLLVPTALMGATLPLVMKSSLTRGDAVGQRMGLLYGTNTAGAIVGALLAGFVLIPVVGVSWGFRLAASINILIGLVALLAARQLAPATGTGEAPAAIPDALPVSEPVLARDAYEASPLARRLVLVVFLLSGITSLALEVLWFRVLVIFLRPTTYSFTLMLATVLAGIAIGSYTAAPILNRRRNYLAWLAGIELSLGVAALSSFQGLGLSVIWSGGLRERLAEFPTLAYLSPLLLASLLAILPTSLLLGMAFPIGLRIWAGGNPADSTVARRIGLFYSLNVCGAIIGSLAAGFVLIPRLGSPGTLLVLSSATLAAGLLLLWPLMYTSRRFALGAGGLSLAVFGLLAWVAVDPFDVALNHFHRNERRLWREEGVQTSVAIHERITGNRLRDRMRIMYLDGMHQSNDAPSTLFVHRRIGFLPTALHPNPQRALVVGLGAGTTPGAIARFPNVEVDVVELSSSVVAGARYFRQANFDLFARPNVHLRVDDGRNFLLLSEPKQYDIITADVILPRHAGAGNVYSVQYFELVKRALKDDGFALQWNGGDTRTEYAIILRTFMEVFPHTTLWGDGSLMLGTKEPLRIDVAAFERKLGDPATRAVLDEFNLGSVNNLLGQFVAGPEMLRALIGEGQMTTDDKPLVEYFLSRPTVEGPMDLSDFQGDVRPFLSQPPSARHGTASREP
jgi:spermidine synthase